MMKWGPAMGPAVLVCAEPPGRCRGSMRASKAASFAREMASRACCFSRCAAQISFIPGSRVTYALGGGSDRCSHCHSRFFCIHFTQFRKTASVMSSLALRYAANARNVSSRAVPAASKKTMRSSVDFWDCFTNGTKCLSAWLYWLRDVSRNRRVPNDPSRSPGSPAIAFLMYLRRPRALSTPAGHLVWSLDASAFDDPRRGRVGAAAARPRRRRDASATRSLAACA
mmetsp:Transcript_22740/g.70324  ORF Transcript_22740/g.70324 Transcript_22740/m.70324 type:complete len:226 (-) Transcript_22740:79-756(-)